MNRTLVGPLRELKNKVVAVAYGIGHYETFLRL